MNDSYTKQIWYDYPNTSTPITAERLNHMEDGIEGAWEHGGGGSSMPTGSIIQFAGSTAPSGYMICDGSAISRTTYANLFNVIGTTYGVGDESTTFNIPNLKGKIGVGLDSNDTDFDTLGETGGEKTHTLTTQEMPSHYHDENYGSARWVDSGGLGVQSPGNKVSYGGGGSEKINITANTGGGQAHNNLQPYVILNYIIKVS